MADSLAARHLRGQAGRRGETDPDAAGIDSAFRNCGLWRVQLATRSQLGGVREPDRIGHGHGHASATGPPVATAVIIVKEYFAAINHGHYAKAWRLGGSNFSPSFAAYVAGFQGTVHDVVTIISVKGSVVTAGLSALQADGTTKVYQGTYTVVNGVITKSSIRQVS